MGPLPKVDITQPKFDQSTYMGRLKHFFLLTNPLNLLATNRQLERARRIVHDYRDGKDVPDCKNIDDLWRAKYLYDSAFHPETDEKVILIGRMSTQMPINMIITGCMLAFYKTTRAVVFWQWINQTYNATVNYSNRSGKSPITTKQLMTSYVLATSGALGTALSLNRMVKNLHPLIGRLVPLVAISAANAINIPMMRIQELRKGIAVVDENDTELAYSKKAAAVGISTVVLSRISMAIPTMVLTPILVESLEKQGFLKKYPQASAPIQTLFCGFLLIFSTPMGCAFFKQRAEIKVAKLEKHVQETIKYKRPNQTVVWYNKGL